MPAEYGHGPRAESLLLEKKVAGMADKDVERIKYKTEVLKLLTVLTAAVGGGSLSLVIGDLTLLRVSLATVGILVALALFVAAWLQHRTIERLIEHLSEDP
jgi:hypothetical protein